MRVLVAGFKHETNTFAPDLAPWEAFEAGEIFPAAVRGAALLDMLEKVPVPAMGFARVARELGWELVPSLWCGAMPSSYVTAEAFERICDEICADAAKRNFDAVYLDLHGAAMAQGFDDAEGELLRRVRALLGNEIPIVVSLDLHANVTYQMLDLADAMVAFRTYPHVDYVETGALTAEALRRRFARGQREVVCRARLPFLIPINSQNTTFGKPKEIYDRLLRIDAELGTLSNFCMGFPSADFEECAPMIWSAGDHAAEAVRQLELMSAEPTQWRLNVYTAEEAVLEAVRRGGETGKPVIIADTQDNPGIGGTGSTTGMLHALIKTGAGKIFPKRIAVGVMNDAQFAEQATHAGVGARFHGRLGQSSMLWDGPSDPPVEGEFLVRATSDGRVTYKGPKMTGFVTELGCSVCVEIDGILVVVSSAKIGTQDRELFRFVGIEPERMQIIVVKSSNHFRADFVPLVVDEQKDVLTAKARGAMAVDPGDLPWRKLPEAIRRRP